MTSVVRTKPHQASKCLTAKAANSMTTKIPYQGSFLASHPTPVSCSFFVARVVVYLS